MFCHFIPPTLVEFLNNYDSIVAPCTISQFWVQLKLIDM